MKFLACAIVFPLVLLAADFWESKPYEDWSDKDVQKMLTNSPWARRVTATMASAGSPSGAASQDARETSTGNPGGFDRPDRESGIDLEANRRQAAPSQGIPAVVRWMTALPVRQAQVRGKYGKEAGTSPDAQKYLIQPRALYLISVAGLPGLFVSGGAGDQAKQTIALNTTLSAKGKDPLRPIGVEFVPNGGRVDVLIGFPKVAPYTLEDQEVVFSSQIGGMKVDCRFKLKDMIFKGKLEL